MRRAFAAIDLGSAPAKKFGKFEKVFDFLDAFDGILVSGREKLIKPGPRIDRLLLVAGLAPRPVQPPRIDRGQTS